MEVCIWRGGHKIKHTGQASEWQLFWKSTADSWASRFGALALGLDRIAVESSIPEVIAFPKNNKACDLMTDSPTQVDFKQLRELYVQSTWKEKKELPETVAQA